MRIRHQTRSSGQRGAVDRGDDRLRDPRSAVNSASCTRSSVSAEPAPPPSDPFRRRTRARSRQSGSPRRAVSIRRIQRMHQSLRKVETQRVALLRPIQSQVEDAVLASDFKHSDIDLHPEQRRAVGLALRIHAQRHRAAAAQRFVQQEIERAQVGQFEALDLALSPDRRRNAFTRSAVTSRSQRGIIFLAPGNHADIRGVALIAGPRVRSSLKGRFMRSPRPCLNFFARNQRRPVSHDLAHRRPAFAEAGRARRTVQHQRNQFAREAVDGFAVLPAHADAQLHLRRVRDSGGAAGPWQAFTPKNSV